MVRRRFFSGMLHAHAAWRYFLALVDLRWHGQGLWRHGHDGRCPDAAMKGCKEVGFHPLNSVSYYVILSSLVFVWKAWDVAWVSWKHFHFMCFSGFSVLLPYISQIQRCLNDGVVKEPWV